eukprot:jgi/Bigna1/128742/aug1.7_g3450
MPQVNHALIFWEVHFGPSVVTVAKTRFVTTLLHSLLDYNQAIEARWGLSIQQIRKSKSEFYQIKKRELIYEIHESRFFSMILGHVDQITVQSFARLLRLFGPFERLASHIYPMIARPPRAPRAFVQPWLHLHDNTSHLEHLFNHK